MKRLAIAFGCLALLVLVGRSAAEDKKSGVVVNKDKKTITIDAKVAPRKLEHLKGEVYPIELIACWAHPKGKKAHETVVTIEADPSEVHAGLVQLGLKPGKPARGEAAKRGRPGPQGRGTGSERVHRSARRAGGTKRLTMDKILMDPKTKKPAPKMTFIFTGSVMIALDPNKPDMKKYGADVTGSLITLFPVTDEVVLQTGWTMKEEKFLKLEVRPDVLPKEGTPVKLVIEAK